MRCQNCSLLHLPLSFRFSQRELQSVWRMKEILPQLLHWPDFCQTYLFLGEDLPVWWHLTFMPCRSNMGGITFYNYFFLSFFGWSLSCFPCLSFSVVKFLALIIWLFVAIQERFYFGDNILPCFESGIPLLKRRLQDLPDSDNVRILRVFISSIWVSVFIVIFWHIVLVFPVCFCEFWLWKLCYDLSTWVNSTQKTSLLSGERFITYYLTELPILLNVELITNYWSFSLQVIKVKQTDIYI